MKLHKSLRLSNGTVVPRGTVLNFSTEGFANFKGHKIPKVAIEGEQMFKAFKDVKPGDKGEDMNLAKITILDKGVGKKAYEDLLKKYKDNKFLLAYSWDDFIASIKPKNDKVEFVFVKDADGDILSYPYQDMGALAYI